MNFDISILRDNEKAVFALRKLFTEYNYRHFKMSKFEEYDLYSKNKDFLVSDGVITFNDSNGKLLALKPDVTLSIIKNCKENSDGTEKYYYNENVYRIANSSGEYKEIMQSGLECIGAIGDNEVFEVTSLALKSLSVLSNNYILHLSHIGLVESLIEEYGISSYQKDDVVKAIIEKNGGLLKSVCNGEQFDALKCLIKKYSSNNEALNAIENVTNEKSKKYFNELKNVYNFLCENGYADNVNINASILNFNGYYSGIVFKGYINGISSKVLSGGQYDKLTKRMGKNASALGFAVYLDELERKTTLKENENEFINVALPKGRLGEKVYAMFEKAGFECPSIKENNRKLIFENTEKRIRYFWVKPSDVAIYVERGAADIGVAGEDIILEYSPDVYELLDLNIGKCRMAVAAKSDFVDDETKTLRVATKFSNIAKSYYSKKCRDIDIIHLNGSIEIAPILNLSDVIVDIVETGKTLLENNLVPFETITNISARLISNKSSYSFKANKIEEIKKELLNQVENND